ncbi:MAG TPA: lipid-binding SYLF domain-containing protein [Tepidisphaeraceae bacterium]|nr:lipid-binding SYLF domain-containing protein [Tepidisphaeraceae bacterium]
MGKAIGCAVGLMVIIALAGCSTAPSSSSERQALVEESNSSLRQMEAADAGMARFVNGAYGYAIFPSAGKGGLIVGGAYGRGVVYEKGQFIGYSDISQATVGLQAGGQSFAELVVFETRTDLNRFTAGKLSLAANVSAVILKTGAADSARYTNGVAVFVEPIGGAMLEASIGGQQFTFDPK